MTTRKAIRIKDLQARHFIAWLRKQVRAIGRHAIVGYIGDHTNNPLEMWLQELTGEQYIPVSACNGFYTGSQSDGTDVTYYLSSVWEGFAISVLEGDPDALPECGYRTVTAWEMLQTVINFMDEGTRLVLA